MNLTQRACDYIKTNPYAPTSEVETVTGVSGRTARRAKLMMRGEVKVRSPKILIFDLETAPAEVYVFFLGKQRINPANVKKDWSILSWSAKWLFDSEIMSERVTTDEAMNREDERILYGLWNLIDEADIIIAHNCVGFDAKKMNARFILNGFNPPMSYQIVDTLTASRKHFGHMSHKLDYLNRLFDISRKIETSRGLWDRCVTGDEDALIEMETYNRGDVVALEELYIILRPWIKSHPNMGLYIDSVGNVCGNCGSGNLDWNGFYYTPAGRFQAYRCISCGAVGRSRYSDLTQEERKELTVSVAR